MIGRLIIILAFGLSSLHLQAQELNKVVFDSTLQKEVLVGPCDFGGLVSFPGYSAAYLENYHAYQPDMKVIQELHPHLQGISITIVLGVWCSDSKEQVPRVVKVLELSGYVPEQVHYIAVDRKKQVSDSPDILPPNIERVPTIILYRDGQEIGRIVETPLQSIESDLLQILKAAADGSKPAPTR
jgi:hypothetical protein